MIKYDASSISFYIISLGCSKNLVDSERVNGELIAAGFLPAVSSESAQMIIVNTCGFINDAKEESISTIFEATDFISENKIDGDGFQKAVVAMGCLTQRYYDEISSEFGELDFVYGIPKENFVKDLCERFSIEFIPRSFSREPLVRGVAFSHIKISEGCSNNCSYCAIPMIRGPLHSFSHKNIIEDAKNSVRLGAKELIIIAQDIVLYKDGDIRLPQLLDMVSRETDIEWIRLLYAHPDHITDDIIGIFQNNKNVVPYIDVPFQHVNDRIVKSMGRKGNYEIYKNLVQRLRSTVPDISIRSTFMIGYPGETDDEFEEIITFIKEMRLNRVGAFLYSPEDGTRANELNDQVDEEIKVNRYNRFMEIQREISLSKLQEMIDKEVTVLVEEKVDNHSYIGRTRYDAPEIDGVFYLTGENIDVNSFVKARVVDAIEYDLIGELL